MLGSIISKFDAEAKNHMERQSLNPFSGSFSRSPSPRLSKDQYGRPVAGSKTEERGQRAKCHILKEILDLCNCIYDIGMYNKTHRPKDDSDDEDTNDDEIIVSFGEIFQIYTKINDKVVGLLIAAKKRGFLYFEKEILFQRRDDDVLIALIKPIKEIRSIINKELAAHASPVPFQSREVSPAVEDNNRSSKNPSPERITNESSAEIKPNFECQNQSIEMTVKQSEIQHIIEPSSLNKEKVIENLTLINGVSTPALITNEAEPVTQSSDSEIHSEKQMEIENIFLKDKENECGTLPNSESNLDQVLPNGEKPLVTDINILDKDVSSNTENNEHIVSIIISNELELHAEDLEICTKIEQTEHNGNANQMSVPLLEITLEPDALDELTNEQYVDTEISSAEESKIICDTETPLSQDNTTINEQVIDYNDTLQLTQEITVQLDTTNSQEVTTEIDQPIDELSLLSMNTTVDSKVDEYNEQNDIPADIIEEINNLNINEMPDEYVDSESATSSFIPVDNDNLLDINGEIISSELSEDIDNLPIKNVDIETLPDILSSLYQNERKSSFIDENLASFSERCSSPDPCDEEVEQILQSQTLSQTSVSSMATETRSLLNTDDSERTSS